MGKFEAQARIIYEGDNYVCCRSASLIRIIISSHDTAAD